ncbi:hypothetical protein GLYMA_08G302700v4 [Glycine max]|uniref:Uncharacterized protein n=1 Tax=Glycine max TaxID=3847 RepID=K7L9V6_SOYBN|nr:hypothetical protein JHK85_023525 [Glycine max]KAH1053872.1 hypothetical protein GYH30_022893 [Glycine max]KRH45949.1 hypothetical protein GLYMA_08G302700v4 [Glycine max]
MFQVLFSCSKYGSSMISVNRCWSHGVIYSFIPLFQVSLAASSILLMLKWKNVLSYLFLSFFFFLEFNIVCHHKQLGVDCD